MKWFCMSYNFDKYYFKPLFYEFSCLFQYRDFFHWNNSIRMLKTTNKENYDKLILYQIILRLVKVFAHYWSGVLNLYSLVIRGCIGSGKKIMTITTRARVVVCVLSNGTKNKKWVLTMMLSFSLFIYLVYFR